MQKVAVVCIIDDDDSVRLATKNLVRSLGYEAHCFASAEDFLQSPELARASCLIADVQMPGMSGIDLQKWLRSNGWRVPVILITAFFEERIRRRALDAGALCLLGKPFDCRTLIRCLDTALQPPATPTKRIER